VRTAESRLSPLGAEIERAVDLVNNLKRRRDEFSHYIAEHQAFLAPMRRLPAELLSQIFSRYCDHAYSKESNRSSRFRQHPFGLAKVCRRWRAIVLSTPEIWSKFRLEFDGWNMKHRIAKIHAWFAKSGTCPLSLGLKGHYYQPIPTQGRHPMLNAIIPYCDRIESLDLDVLCTNTVRLDIGSSRLPGIAVHQN
jgi:F-box-like